MEIIKSNTIKEWRKTKKYWNTHRNVVCLLEKRVAKLKNTVIQEKQRPVGLYAVIVDLPLPFVMDSYLYKTPIFSETDTNAK